MKREGPGGIPPFGHRHMGVCRKDDIGDLGDEIEGKKDRRREEKLVNLVNHPLGKREGRYTRKDGTNGGRARRLQPQTVEISNGDGGKGGAEKSEDRQGADRRMHPGAKRQDVGEGGDARKEEEIFDRDLYPAACRRDWKDRKGEADCR
ncbi:MAG: hypothetical protein KAG89_16085 [Fulvimarina manganoxydans]|nr:hypothetical protein [Fulvimarina manganoxydans]